MKNIWKLLLIALLAFAMIGCPATKEDDDDSSSGGSGSESRIIPQVPENAEGVYTWDASLDTISKAWGGSSAAPAFSICFMDQIAIDMLASGALTDAKSLPVGSPVYQLQGKGNASFLTALEGTWKTKYTGLCAKVENGRYTVYVDTANLEKTELKGIGKDFGNDGEKVLGNDDEMPDMSNYAAILIALTDSKDVSTDYGYIGNMWDAQLFMMKKTTVAYPAAQDTPALVKFSIKFTGKSHIDSADAELKGDQTIDWTVSNVEYYTGAAVPFNFFADNSGVTNEVAAADATLTATLTAGAYDWEGAQNPGTEYNGQTPNASWTYKISKKCNLGTASDIWLGFNALTDTYAIPE